MATTAGIATMDDKADRMAERRDIVDEDAMTAKDLSVDAAAKGQGVSGYETLSLWQSVKAFKVNTAVCFAVAFSAATDGYQIGSAQLFLCRKADILTQADNEIA